jgi:hypothetical protein
VTVMRDGRTVRGCADGGLSKHDLVSACSAGTSPPRAGTPAASACGRGAREEVLAVEEAARPAQECATRRSVGQGKARSWDSPDLARSGAVRNGRAAFGADGGAARPGAGPPLETPPLRPRRPRRGDPGGHLLLLGGRKAEGIVPRCRVAR